MIEIFQTTPKDINGSVQSVYDFFYDCAIFLKQKLNIPVEESVEGTTKNITLKIDKSFYFKFSIVDGGHSSANISVYAGVDQYSNQNISYRSNDYLYYGILTIINNGAHWQFEIKRKDEYQSRYTTFNICSTQLISSVTKDIFYSGRVDTDESEITYIDNFYSNVSVLDPQDMHYNIPNGKILLLPAFLYTTEELNLSYGVLTIGNSPVYYISNGIEISPYTEFYIENKSFIHLYDNLVIRSL